MKKPSVVLCIFLAIFSNLFAHEPSPKLDDFWKQWQKQRLTLQTRDGQRFIRAYGRQWSPSMIPDMIRDVLAHEPAEGELRDYVYCTAILYIPDRKGCEMILAKIRAAPHPDEAIALSDSVGDIAYDFQSAIIDQK